MNFVDKLTDYQPQNEQEIIDQSAMLSLIQLCPDAILFRENPVAHMTSSGFIVNHNLTKTLLIHHNIYRAWGWTGGHADGDGDLARVACKEAVEETGILANLLSPEIAAIDILPVHSHTKNGAFVNAHLHFNLCYLLLADDARQPRSKPNENSGAAWFPLTELQACVNEAHMLPVYRKLIKKVNDLRCNNK